MMTEKQIAAVKALGVTASAKSLEGFAEACYDQNSVDELIEAFASSTDAVDCKEWRITPTEWRAAIFDALSRHLSDSETD